MEIGDIFAVNKADMPGADTAARTLEDALAAAYMGEPGVNTPERLVTAVSRAPSTMPGLVALRCRHGDYERDESVWVPPVLKLCATENRGVAELARAIDLFLDWSTRTGRRAERSRERAYAQIIRELAARLLEPYVRAPGATEWPEVVKVWVEKISERKASPAEAAHALFKHAGRQANVSRRVPVVRGGRTE